MLGEYTSVFILPWEGKIVVGGPVWEESMSISSDFVGTEFPKAYRNAGINCETAFCFLVAREQREPPQKLI